MAQGLIWLTPYKSAKREKIPWPRWLSHKRYLIDTVFSQLTERFHAKRVWARDTWHFFSRWLRKILVIRLLFSFASNWICRRSISLN
jgi:hypothetical protein